MAAVNVIVGILVLVLIVAAMSIRVIKQYERVVLFELGKVKEAARGPGLIFIVPIIDRVHRVSLRIITMPIQSQGIITKDNVSIDVSAVAYTGSRTRSGPWSRSRMSRRRSTRSRRRRAAVVGRHTLDETLSRDRLDQSEHSHDPRRPDRGMGNQGHRRRAARHPCPNMQRAMARHARPSARSAPSHRRGERSARRRRVGPRAPRVMSSPASLRASADPSCRPFEAVSIPSRFFASGAGRWLRHIPDYVETSSRSDRGAGIEPHAAYGMVRRGADAVQRPVRSPGRRLAKLRSARPAHPRKHLTAAWPAPRAVRCSS